MQETFLRLGLQETFLRFGIALGLGLLVGFQRERTESGLAGVRTFALITLTGALAAQLDRLEAGSWILTTAGLLGLTALACLGNLAGWRRNEPRVGITTEVAVLLMYLVGALCVAGRLALAVVLGGGVAVLLQAKRPMHGLAEQLSDDEVRALTRIVLLGLVILPVLPDETYGPYDVLNPFAIWLMVVLIVGISVASFIVYRLVSARTGTLLGGVLGGFISSTAATASYARRVRESPGFAPTAAAAVMVASTVVFARIFLEIAAVAPALLPHVSAPLAAMAGVNVALCALGLWRMGGSAPAMSERSDPSELKAALLFGALYGAILFAVAAAKEHFGDAGLYGVAAVSGLTDVDAITLSIANLADVGRVDVSTAWRAILVAALANLVFKGCLAFVLAGPRLLRPLAPLFVPSLAAGLAILLLGS